MVNVRVEVRERFFFMYNKKLKRWKTFWSKKKWKTLFYLIGGYAAEFGVNLISEWIFILLIPYNHSQQFDTKTNERGLYPYDFVLWLHFRQFSDCEEN